MVAFAHLLDTGTYKNPDYPTKEFQETPWSDIGLNLVCTHVVYDQLSSSIGRKPMTHICEDIVYGFLLPCKPMMAKALASCEVFKHHPPVSTVYICRSIRLTIGHNSFMRLFHGIVDPWDRTCSHFDASIFKTSNMVSSLGYFSIFVAWLVSD